MLDRVDRLALKLGKLPVVFRRETLRSDPRPPAHARDAGRPEHRVRLSGEMEALATLLEETAR